MSIIESRNTQATSTEITRIKKMLSIINHHTIQVGANNANKRVNFHLKSFRNDIIMEADIIPAIAAAVKPRTDQFRHQPQTQL